MNRKFAKFFVLFFNSFEQKQKFVDINSKSIRFPQTVINTKSIVSFNFSDRKFLLNNKDFDFNFCFTNSLKDLFFFFKILDLVFLLKINNKLFIYTEKFSIFMNLFFFSKFFFIIFFRFFYINLFALNLIDFFFNSYYNKSGHMVSSCEKA